LIQIASPTNGTRTAHHDRGVEVKTMKIVIRPLEKIEPTKPPSGCTKCGDC
jgi:hypothetical protein